MFKFFNRFKKKEVNEPQNNTPVKLEMEREAGVQIDVLSKEEIMKLGFDHYDTMGNMFRPTYGDDSKMEEYKQFCKRKDNALEKLVRFTNTETNQVAYVGLKNMEISCSFYDSAGDDFYVRLPARMVVYDGNLKERYMSSRRGVYVPYPYKGHWRDLSSFYSSEEYKAEVEKSCAELEDSGYKGFLVKAIRAMSVAEYNESLDEAKQAIREEEARRNEEKAKDEAYKKLDVDMYAAFLQKSR